MTLVWLNDDKSSRSPEFIGYPLKTNISPKNWWLEDDSFPFKMVPFQVTFVSFQGGIHLGFGKHSFLLFSSHKTRSELRYTWSVKTMRRKQGKTKNQSYTHPAAEKKNHWPYESLQIHQVSILDVKKTNFCLVFMATHQIANNKWTRTD